MPYLSGRVESRFQATFDRINEILEPAAEIVERELGGRVDVAHIAVVSTRDMADKEYSAHRALFGQSVQPPRWGWRAPAGLTTVSPHGTLVLFNAQVLRGNRRQIDKTVLHELGHAVQFGRPGARELIMRGERHNYGVPRLPEAEARALDALVGQREREAERLERLAHKLPR